jgi:hypothetical protein
MSMDASGAKKDAVSSKIDDTTSFSFVKPYFSSAVNTIVRPSGLSARMVPRCPSAMLRAMGRPMPKPPVSALRAATASTPTAT